MRLIFTRISPQTSKITAFELMHSPFKAKKHLSSMRYLKFGVQFRPTKFIDNTFFRVRKSAQLLRHAQRIILEKTSCRL